MQVGENPLTAIWSTESSRLKDGSPTLLLNESDLQQTPILAIPLKRFRELVEGLMNQIEELPVATMSYADIRDAYRSMITNLLPRLALLNGLPIFNLDSDSLHLLNNLISKIITNLSDQVYQPEPGACLIDNEWLLAQNDLALCLEIADHVPAAAPQIGQSFGKLYQAKRELFVDWTQYNVGLSIEANDSWEPVCTFLNDLRPIIVATLSCSRHFVRVFAMDNRLQIHSPIDMEKFESFLQLESFVRVDWKNPDYLLYLTKNLARNPKFLSLFLETRINDPRAFGNDFMIIVPTGSKMIDRKAQDKIEVVNLDEQFLSEDLWLKGDLSAFEPNEILFSGRSATAMDLFLRKFATTGFNATSTYLRPSIKPFPFAFYPLMRSYRSTGMQTTISMLHLAKHLLKMTLDTGKEEPYMWKSDKFNFLNRAFLYSIEFGGIISRLSRITRDELFEKLIGLFLNTSITWIGWLSKFDSPEVPNRVVNRWTVSAFDMFIPLIFILEFRMADRLSPEQLSILSNALERLEVRKQKAQTENSDSSNTVESVSMFKWRRIHQTINSLISNDTAKMEPFKCEPMQVRFMSPFEEFISSPLEKAIAPLHYQLVEKVYTGPNATLFKCIDLNTGNFVAAKQFYTKERCRHFGMSHGEDELTYPYSSSSSSSTSSSFSPTEDERDMQQESNSLPLKEALKETEILKVVQGHPNVVTYINSSYERPYFFLLMEYYAGGTLADNRILSHRDPSKQDAEQVWRVRYNVCKQIKETLVHIHELGVIHGDIKPSNIFLDTHGKVHLGDFGSAEFVPKVPTKNVPLCLQPKARKIENFTIPYMAPELLERAQPTWASDIWAFGCIALEIATGAAPWSGLCGAEILVKLAEGQSPIKHAATRLVGVPVNFIKIIEACLVRDVSSRPTARDLLEHHYLA